jgi:hypothetical protein
MKKMISYAVRQCSSEKAQHFRGTFQLHLQSRRISQERTPAEVWSGLKYLAFSELHGITTQMTAAFKNAVSFKKVHFFKRRSQVTGHIMHN